MFRTIPPAPLDLIVEILWPQERSGGLLPRATEVFLQPGDKRIDTIQAMAIYVSLDEGVVWAEIEMFADEGGMPLLTGKPMMTSGGLSIIRKTFTAHVIKMRSLASYQKGYAVGATKRIKEEAAK